MGLLREKIRGEQPHMKSNKFKGIRKRWMVNSISVVLLIVLLAVTAFSVALAGYYYSSMSSELKGKAESAVSQSTARTETEYLQYAQDYVSNRFSDQDGIQVQFINAASGTVQVSSYGNDDRYGLTAGTMPDTPDISGAIETVDTVSWTGNDPQTGEHIMAVSSPLVINGGVVAVARMVTSLRLVDRQMTMIIVIALLIGALILALVYFSNLYFVRSIVEPVASITETAKRIAAGSYGIQIEKKFDDEIGDLTDTINDMSLKIKQSEKLKSEFIASVSHELRTPLTAINGWAETIQNGEVRDAGDVRKGMNIIVSEARRLTNMVEELLEFSRIEDGRFTLSIEPVDIKAELEDAVYTYKEFFRSSRWTSRPSWRTRCTPTRSSSARRALFSTTRTPKRSSPPSRPTRSGCGRCSQTSLTTPPSTAAAANGLTPPSAGRRTRLSSPSGTTDPVSPRRNCPT